MTGDVPTIDEGLAAFLAARQAAAKPNAFRRYADIVDFLKSSLNGYASDSLNQFERRRWEKAFEDGDEAAFTKLFGPDKIPERLGRLLYEQAQRTRIDQSALADEDYVEDYLAIERVEPSALWFEGDIGPVPVSAAAAKLAQPAWSINLVLGRKGGKWHLLEVGNVYP